MARKSKQQSLTLGFFGSGEVSEKETHSLLEDFLGEVEGDVTFVVPATKEHTTDTIKAVVAYATDAEIPYEIVTDDTGVKARNLSSIVKGASKTHKVARIANKIASVLTSKPESILVAIWDEEDEDLEVVVNRVHEADITIRDLTTALEPVELDFEDDEEEEEEEPEEKPKKSRGKSKEPDPEPDEEEDDEDFEPYTRKELEEASRDTVIEIAEKDFGIEIKPRVRQNTLIELILAAQDEESGEEPSEEPEDDEEVPEVDPGALAEQVAEAVLAKLEDILKPVHDAIEEMVSKEDLAAMEERWLKALEEAAQAPPATDPDPEDDEPEEKPTKPTRRRKRRL